MGDDLSVRLIEWIELLTTLGADKIFLYNLEVHPNVTKVLEHYTAQGKVDVTPISLPGHQLEVRDEHIQGNTNPNLQDESASCTCVCPKGRRKEESTTLFSPNQDKGPRHFQYDNDKIFKTALKIQQTHAKFGRWRC